MSRLLSSLAALAAAAVFVTLPIAAAADPPPVPPDRSTKLRSADPGTAALPAWTWLIDEDTGIYRYAANQIGCTVGGVGVLHITSAGILGEGSTLDVLSADGSGIRPSNSAGLVLVGTSGGKYMIRSAADGAAININSRLTTGDYAIELWNIANTQANEFTKSSGEQGLVYLYSNNHQTGTARFNGIHYEHTETSGGSGGTYMLDFLVGGARKITIDKDGNIVGTTGSTVGSSGTRYNTMFGSIGDFNTVVKTAEIQAAADSSSRILLPAADSTLIYGDVAPAGAGVEGTAFKSQNGNFGTDDYIVTFYQGAGSAGSSDAGITGKGGVQTGRQIAASVNTATAFGTCALALAGVLVYVDDTNDGLAPFRCRCQTTGTDGVYQWTDETSGALLTACP